MTALACPRCGTLHPDPAGLTALGRDMHAVSDDAWAPRPEDWGPVAWGCRVCGAAVTATATTTEGVLVLEVEPPADVFVWGTPHPLELHPRVGPSRYVPPSRSRTPPPPDNPPGCPACGRGLDPDGRCGVCLATVTWPAVWGEPVPRLPDPWPPLHTEAELERVRSGREVVRVAVLWSSGVGLLVGVLSLVLGLPYLEVLAIAMPGLLYLVACLVRDRRQG